VLISGGGKEGDERYVKGNSYGTAYITEVNECAQSFIQEVFDRTLSSSIRKIFLDLNPKSPNHWFYLNLLDVQSENSFKYGDYGFNYSHFTLFDNLSLDDDKLRTLLRTYDKKSVWYQRDILGNRTNAEGLIYDMFGPGNEYKDGEGPDYELWYQRWYAVDYGTTNPFACYEIVEQNGKHYIESEYYYDSKKHNKQKADADYVEDIIKFMTGPDGKLKRYNAVIIDPSAASFKVALRNKNLNSRERAEDEILNANNDVLNGIRLVSSLWRAQLLMVNKPKCPNLISELSSYIWDEKASERGLEEPVKMSDHGCDAVRYYASTIIRRMPGG